MLRFLASPNAASEWFGLAGGAISAIGVALALVGIGKVRAAVRKFREWVGPQAVSVTVSPATISVTADVLTPTIKVSPGDEQEWNDEEWHGEFERRLDAFRVRLDTHDHSRTEKSIERLREEDDRIRSEMNSRLADLNTEADTSETWNLWGLVLALAGALLQIAAVVVLS